MAAGIKRRHGWAAACAALALPAVRNRIKQRPRLAARSARELLERDKEPSVVTAECRKLASCQPDLPWWGSIRPRLTPRPQAFSSPASRTELTLGRPNSRQGLASAQTGGMPPPISSDVQLLCRRSLPR